MLVKFENGTELEFDVYDADMADAYNDVKKSIFEASETMTEASEKPGDVLRLMFKTISDGFDLMFGEGIGLKVCGERPNAKVALKAFGVLVDSENEQVGEMEKLAANAVNKNKKK